MNFSTNWIRGRWMDGRVGNSVYLLFSLVMINTILISYRFLIENDQTFTELFPNLWIYAVIFLILYFPVSILIGRWHVCTQLKVENILKVYEEPIPAKMFRIMLDIQTGIATKSEIEEARKMIEEIEKT